MGRPPSDAQDKFIIRLPDGMREQLSDAAKANERTMTAEVVARLRDSLKQGDLGQEVEHLRAEVRMLGSRLWALENEK